MTDDTRDSIWPMFLLAIAAFLWALYAIWALAGSGIDLRTMMPLEGVRLLGELLVGPALLLALAAAFRPRPRAAVRSPLEAAALSGEELEARTTGLVARLEAVSNKVAGDIDRIDALSGRLEQQAVAATRQAAEALQAIESLTSGAQAFDARLASALSATGDMERLLATLSREAAEARAAAIELTGQSDALRQQAEASATALRAAIVTLASEAEATIRISDTANSDLRETVAQQVAALSSATHDARTTLSAIGAEAARALGRHLDSLVGQARELEGRITAQATATEELAGAAERSFQLLDKRMEHSAQTTGATLEQLKAQLEAVHSRIDALAEPIRAARSVVLDMDQAVTGLRGTADAAEAAFSGDLASSAIEAQRLTDELSASLESLSVRLADARAAAEQLAEPVARSSQDLDQIVGRFDTQREAMAVAGEALVVELEQARQLIAEVEKTTESTSLAAATRLVDALSRVRDVSAQATGTMRAMLDGLVEEARQSLGNAATDAVRAGFVERIADEAARAEDKARAAAERSASALAGLAEAVRMVDGRADQRMQELAAIADRDLASAAALVSERLAADAINLSHAMGKPMSETDWAQWRKGERGLFGRRLVALVDKGEAAALKTLLKGDQEAAAAASRLVAGMNALLDRLEAAGQGSVAALVRGSEWGRLAAALSEVLED
jgi:uncharacterized coiled-coil DUF342 family protein